MNFVKDENREYVADSRGILNSKKYINNLLSVNELDRL